MSEDNIVSLGKERVGRSQDCRDWSVMDALEAAIEYVKVHPELKFDAAHVMLNIDDGENARYTQYFSAGTDKRELVGWLAMHTSRIILED